MASFVVEEVERTSEPGEEVRKRRWNSLLDRPSCIAAAVGEEVESIVEVVERRCEV